MKIWLVQMEPSLGDKKINLGKIINYIEKGIENNVQFIAFPELALTGYMCGKDFHILAETIPGPTTEKIENIIQDKNIYVVFGMPELQEGIAFNSAPIFGPKGLIGIYRKLFLPTCVIRENKPGYVYDEGLYFKGGQDIETFETSFGKVGIEICYDFWFPEIMRIHSLNGACLLLNISACPFQWTSTFQLLARARSVENLAWFGYVNMVGEQKGVVFGGGSCIVDPSTAEIICSGTMGDKAIEEVIEKDIDLKIINNLRLNFPILRDVRPEILGKTFKVAQGKYFPK